MKRRDLEAINAQFIISILLAITLIISFIVLYDEKQRIENKENILGDKYKYVNLFNHILFLLTLIYSLYVNYQQYQRKKGGQEAPFKHQVYASVFNVIGGIITLYVVLETWNQVNIDDFENTT